MKRFITLDVTEAVEAMAYSLLNSRGKLSDDVRLISSVRQQLAALENKLWEVAIEKAAERVMELEDVE